MNSLANNDSNYFNARNLEHKEVAVSENKHPFKKSKQQQKSKHEQAFCNDVSTASYVRGYN
ncbi:MAG: hypothetical protein JKX90_01190 [Colwellia sp.]|nr:hypothetical protein [Colwellia sp.]